MKIKISLLLCMLCLSVFVPAQLPDKNQNPKKSEMQSQMSEMTKELNKELSDLEKQLVEAKANKADEETIKDLQQQIDAVKKQIELIGGVNKSLSKNVSDKTFQQAMDEDKEGVPQRDIKRIKMLPGKILSENELVVFVKKVHSEVGRLLDEKIKTEANKIYIAAIAEKRSFNYINNIANNLWLAGYPEIAVYMQGKLCEADMSNANNLNNYAAFLTMAGGQQAALPILQNLNQRFPDNSTILNNIAQSWYGLGDMNNANQYLDKTMKIYRNHSQANQTKAKIQKAEGKTQESIESIKRSVKENYTTEKEARLNELGGKLEYDDIPFPYPKKAEPLGIEKFMFLYPAYPFESGTAAVVAEMEWFNFRQKVGEVIKKLEEEKKQIEIKVEDYNKRLLANPRLLKPYNNHVYLTAGRKLQLLIEELTTRTVAFSKKIYAAGDSVKKWRTQMNKDLTDAAERHKNDDDPNAYCSEAKGIVTSFLSKSNLIWQHLNSEELSFEKQFLNAWANLSLYGTTDYSLYELAIVNIKIYFLSALQSLRCEIQIGCSPKAEVQKKQGKVLPDFDEMNCQYKEEYNIPPFTKIKIECNKMSTDFDIDTELGVKIKAGWEENLNSGKITKGTLELGYEAGTDVAKFGPVGAELKASGSVGVEITSDGVQEVYIKGSSTIDVAGNIGESEIIPGVQSDPKGLSGMSADVKVSWNVGSGSNAGTMNSSLTGQGMLSPINL